MNILPKKRWHVRTKENIARVRKDEAEAAELAKKEQKRIESADREARLNVLRLKASEKLRKNETLTSVIQPTTSEDILPHKTEHVDFLNLSESEQISSNTEHDKEIKEKQEAYEKQIGYLTYLGQDTNEALKKQNWYELPPESTRFTRSDNVKETYTKLVLKDVDGKVKVSPKPLENEEVQLKIKKCLDPIYKFKKHIDTIKLIPKRPKISDKEIAKPKKSKNKKRRKRSSSSSSDESKIRDNEKKLKLQKLREERLRREKIEREKANKLLTGFDSRNVEKPEELSVKPKYNSQFNPQLARQNYR